MAERPYAVMMLHANGKLEMWGRYGSPEAAARAQNYAMGLNPDAVFSVSYRPVKSKEPTDG